jgi:hypothetical protein
MASTQYYNDIQKLYVAYFNRPADPGGLAFWESTLEANKGDIATVAANFASQVEYKTTYANMTNEQIVDAVYHNLFGRAADADGKKFYADNMTAGKLSIDQVVLEVAKGAQGNSDGQIFANKVSAAVAFTAALDTQAEIAGYTTDSAPLAKAFLAGITTGATLDAALVPANLNKSVGDLVAKGTTFTVTGALGSLNAANDALKAFYASADGDNDATTSTDTTKLHKAQTDQVTAIHDLMAATTVGGDAARASTFSAVGTSDAVKTALVGDQSAAYAKAIADAQAKVAADQTAVSKVTGLSAAVSARDAAKTVVDNAKTADTAANADLLAKIASYNAIHSDATAQITVDAAGLAKINGTAVFKLDAGKYVLDGVSEDTDHSGITGILNASNTLEAADVTLSNANKALTAAQLNVSHLDVTTAETTELGKVAAIMITDTANSGLKTGELPSEAQITTYYTKLLATKPADAATFNTAVEAYHKLSTVDAADASTKAHDPLTTTLDTDTATLNALTKANADFNTAVTKLNAATSLVNQEAGLQASIDAAGKLFTNAGYHVVNINTDAGTTVTGTAVLNEVATTDSDVFVTGKVNTTVALFGLQGKDVISVGSGFVANTGKLSAGDDAAKEVFIHASAANASDAEIQIESHAFSSHVAGANAPELVTITLTGVNAANLHFDASTGIISLS